MYLTVSSIGINTLNWCGESTGNMSFLDSRCNYYQSEKIMKSFRIEGIPSICLQVKIETKATYTNIITRLEDVNPDDRQISLVTGGLLHHVIDGNR